MAVFVYPMEDRQGKRELFSLSDEESLLISEGCLYPIFKHRIDNYGKTFLYSCHIRAIQDFLTQSIIEKEDAYCYDRDYMNLHSLWERFVDIPSNISLFLLGD